MATNVIYNGVELHNCRTLSWEDEVVMDDSGTDKLFVRHKMRFQCLLHDQMGYYAATPIWTAGRQGYPLANNTVASYQELINRLSQPRADLVVQISGKTALQVSGAQNQDAFHDVDNGPKPGRIVLDQITSGRNGGSAVFMLSFEIAACQVHCMSGSYPQNVLNNRWSVSESLDDKAYISRTIRGKLRLSTPSVSPEVYRALTIPQLEDGFRREAIDFAVSPNGLEAEYSIRDRQTNTAAPWPAMAIDCTHTEATQTGATWSSECRVRLDGHPGADKATLLDLAFQVIEEKLGNFNRINNGKSTEKGLPQVESLVITDYIGVQNTIEVSLRITQTMIGTKQFPTSYDTLATPLKLSGDYSHLKSPQPPAWGFNAGASSNLARPPAAEILLACYLQTPCNDKHAIATAGTYSDNTPQYPSDQSESPAITEHEYTHPTLLPSSDSLSESTHNYLYTIAAVETHYAVKPSRVQMPISGSTWDGNSDTCVTASLGYPTATVRRHYEAERVGAWPEIPRPDDKWTEGGIKGTLLYFDVKAHPPTVDALGNKKIYRLEALYLYALNRPLKPEEQLKIGTIQFTAYTQSEAAWSVNACASSAQAFGSPS